MASMDAGGKVTLTTSPTPSPSPHLLPTSYPSTTHLLLHLLLHLLPISHPISRPNPHPSLAPLQVVLARHNEISTLDVKKLEGQEVNDGERLVLPAKELDVCEIYPQNLLHNSNGRFAVVTGDGEYIIYTVTSRTRSTPLHHLATLSLTLPFPNYPPLYRTTLPYQALAWRKKSFGNALDFVWALDSGEYALAFTQP